MTAWTRSLNVTFRLLTIGATIVSFLWAPASAHELRPAIIAVEIEESGAFELRIALNLEAQIAGINTEQSDPSQSEKTPMYDRLRGSTPDELRGTRNHSSG